MERFEAAFPTPQKNNRETVGEEEEEQMSREARRATVLNPFYEWANMR